MAKVFLSAGHGGSDPGAVANGLKEKDINLQTLLACKEELERHGVVVICSRTTDENDPVTQEVREANASCADLAVSFHANAGKGDGFEGYYYSTDANGKRLVELATKYVAELGQNAHGNPVKTGNKLMFINSTKMTAALFESFFVDNVTDKQIGDTVVEQKAFGVAYAKAILEYFNIAYKTSSSSVQSGNTQTSNPVKKTANEIADEVIAGKWGIGTDRKNRLTAAGYNYSEVQAIVNEKLGNKATAETKKSNETIAREVIAGKWGNGAARKQALKIAGYDPVAIQAIVNKLL